MRLDDEETSMLAGEQGPVRQWALRHQREIGEFFNAEDLVRVGQAHIMGDPEATGMAGIEFLEDLGASSKRDHQVRIPTITDPRGIDFAAYKRLRQTANMAMREERLTAAFEALGVMMTNTCINYQTIMPPGRNEHLAFGDTGVVIYSNSVIGARSNFEGGPSALAAALTGRTPRYGYHLDEKRKGTRHFVLRRQPNDLCEWGALGAIVGQKTGNYWQVPVVSGINYAPTSDQLKHFGAALASFGSVAMFHMPGVTPEAPRLADAFQNNSVLPPEEIGPADFENFDKLYAGNDDKVDVVVFSAPQLSLHELEKLAQFLDGRTVASTTTLIAATSPEMKFAADRMGLTARIEASGALLLSGVCFYQSYAREMAEANGWERLMTNSAKLVNIIGGYGYKPTLGSMERCVASAIVGRIV